jgi:hypothetical protein
VSEVGQDPQSRTRNDAGGVLGLGRRHQRIGCAVEDHHRALGVYSNSQEVDGTLCFTNNTGSAMSLNGSMIVHNFTYSGNALPYAGGLTVNGTSSIS